MAPNTVLETWRRHSRLASRSGHRDDRDRRWPERLVPEKNAPLSLVPFACLEIRTASEIAAVPARRVPRLS